MLHQCPSHSYFAPFSSPYNRCSKSLPFLQVLNLAMNLLYSWKLNSSAVSLKKEALRDAHYHLTLFPIFLLHPQAITLLSLFPDSEKNSSCSFSMLKILPVPIPFPSLLAPYSSSLAPSFSLQLCHHPVSLKIIVHVLTSTDFATPFFFFPSQLNFSRSVFDPYLDFSFQPIRVSHLLPLLKKKCLLRSLQSPHNCPMQ